MPVYNTDKKTAQYSLYFKLKAVEWNYYSIFDDVLTVYLPDGSTSDTELRGLKPESTAKAHLRAYIKTTT